MSSAGDDTTNNLFTDLGPLIALFGEQVSKQFLSQSLGFADDVLFAMAPLGILTGVVSAIRVGGYRWLKAVVGRSSETRGVAGLELTSATSADICELWDGQSVVRLLGTPNILPIVFRTRQNNVGTYSACLRPLSYLSSRHLINHETSDVPPDYVRHRKLWVSDFEGAKAMGWFFQPQRQIQQPRRVTDDWEQTEDATFDDLNQLKPTALPPIPPNLVLNSVVPHSIKKTRLAAGLAVSLQALVLFFGAWISYGWELRPKQLQFAYSMMSVGTAFVVVGMMGCSKIVRTKSQTEKWNPDFKGLEIIWLQKQQVVNDQTFPSFAIYNNNTEQIISFDNEDKKTRPKIVLVFVLLSIIGFICQFVGLRNLHWSVSIVQLISMMLVTGIRVLVRMPFSRLARTQPLRKDFELEWMTRTIIHFNGWEPCISSDRIDPGAETALEKSEEIVEGATTRVADDSESESEATELIRSSHLSTASEVFEIRVELGSMARKMGWNCAFAEDVIMLKSTIEAFTEQLWSSNRFSLQVGCENMTAIPWTCMIVTRDNRHANKMGHDQTRTHVSCSVKRKRVAGVWSRWTAEYAELESLLMLWLSEVCQSQSLDDDGDMTAYLFEPRQYIWAGDLLTPMSSMDFDYFIQHGNSYLEIPASSCTSRIFSLRGRLGIKSPWCDNRLQGHSIYSPLESSCLAVMTYTTLPKLLARYLFGLYMVNVLKNVRTLEGDFSNLHSSADNWPRQASLRHDAINAAVHAIASERLISRHDALMDVIQCLCNKDILPDLTHEFTTADIVASSKTLSQQSFANEERNVLSVFMFMRRLRALKHSGRWTSAKKFIVSSKQRLGRLDIGYQTLNQYADTIHSWERRYGEGTLHGLEPIDEVLVDMQKLQSGQDMNMELLTRLDFGLAFCALDKNGAKSLLSALILSLRVCHWVIVLMVLLEFTDQHIYKTVETGLADLLYLAVERDHRYLLCLMLKISPRPLIFSPHAISPLVAAIQSQNSLFTEVLLDEGISPNLRDPDGRTPLDVAVSLGNEPIVRSLIDAGAQTASACAPICSSPLAIAAAAGNMSIATLLCDSSCDINPPSRQSPKPLQCAIAHGHIKVAELLLERGAELNPLLCDAGRTPLQAAAESGRMGCVEFLITKGAEIDAAPSPSGATALQFACAGGHVDCVEKLLSCGADINKAGGPYGGLTALQAAARSGHVELVHSLIDNGADISTPPTLGGLTALQAAAVSGSLDLFKFFQEKGLDPFEPAAAGGGRTSLQAASENGHDELLRFILALPGASANEVPSRVRGRTALQGAAGFGHLSCVQHLLDHGAAINVAPCEERGRTALQAAAECGHTVICELLISHGAEIDAFPCEVMGLTALQAASSFGDPGLVQMLVEKGANLHAAPAMIGGRTAVQAAAEKGHMPIVRYLLESGAYYGEKPAWFDGVRTWSFVSVDQLPGIVIPEWANKEYGAGDVSAALGWALIAAEGNELAVERLVKEAPESLNQLSGVIKGRTPLQAAAGSGHEYVVYMLLKSGATDDAPRASIDGRTALEAASEGGHAAVVDRLLKAGSKTNVPSTFGSESALVLAARNGHEPVVKLLLAASAEVDEKPDCVGGLTPLQAALERGHTSIAKLLTDAGGTVNTLPPG